MKGVSSRWAGDRQRRILSFKPGSALERAFLAADLRVQVDFFAVLVQCCNRQVGRLHLLDYRLVERYQEFGLAALNAWLPTLSRAQWAAYHQGLDALISQPFDDAADILQHVQALHTRIAAFSEPTL